MPSSAAGWVVSESAEVIDGGVLEYWKVGRLSLTRTQPQQPHHTAATARVDWSLEACFGSGGCGAQGGLTPVVVGRLTPVVVSGVRRGA